MHILPSFLQGIVFSSVAASTFHPNAQPDVSPTWGHLDETAGKKESIPEARGLKLTRMTHPDDGVHPEIRSVQAANRATKKFRRRGISGPEVNGALAIRAAHRSLQRRGMLSKRDNVEGRDSVDSNLSGPTSTKTTSIVPAQTPKTPDSMGISQDGNDFSYFSMVGFGSESKSFMLVIDTGSSDTWIPSSDCKSKSCKLHSTFGPGDSKTLKMTNNDFDIKYGSGDVKGVIASDSIKFAGFEVDASFGIATTVSDDFLNFPIDGILGLGFSNGSQLNVPTILDKLKDGKQIKQKVFGVALSRDTDGVNNGVINFGGIDSTLFDGPLSFSKSVSGDGLWELNMEDAGVDGASLNLGDRTAVIDTGTSLLLIPPKDAMRIHALIPGAETNGETFAVPCNTTATIEFTFNKVTYRVPAHDYMGQALNRNRHLCLSLITGRQILGNKMWLLGDVFLKGVYSVFDLENSRVGFAPKKVSPAQGGSETAPDSPIAVTSTKTQGGNRNPGPTAEQSSPIDLSKLPQASSANPSPSGSSSTAAAAVHTVAIGWILATTCVMVGAMLL